MTEPMLSHAEMADVLIHLGFLTQAEAFAEDGSPNLPAVLTATYRYSVFHDIGIEPRETFARRISDHMQRPRCHCPDILPIGGYGQWPRGHVVTWAVDPGGVSMPSGDVFLAFQVATSAWSEVCGLGFRKIGNPSMANIGAWFKPIDGRYSTLAWSFMPPAGASYSTRLEQRYDTAEAWTLAYLTVVAIHEIGHAIGFPHVAVGTGAIMEPFVGKYARPQPADIRMATGNYGPPSEVPNPQPPPAPPTSPITVISEAAVPGQPGVFLAYIKH